MNSDPSLWPAMSHATDPKSSHVAAAQHRKSGKLSHHLNIVLSAVHAHPGLTSGELEQRCKAIPARDRLAEVRRKLSYLRDRGLIQWGKQRKCTVIGSLQRTYRSVP